MSVENATRVSDNMREAMSQLRSDAIAPFAVIDGVRLLPHLNTNEIWSFPMLRERRLQTIKTTERGVRAAADRILRRKEPHHQSASRKLGSAGKKS